jgi:ArsR family transcriptional regulator
MDQINFFKCLADETRFNIVMLVLGNNEQCVCDLTEKLELSQPKISRHLALLRSSGLLQDRRQGQWVYYSLNPNLPTWCVDVDLVKDQKSVIRLNAVKSWVGSTLIFQSNHKHIVHYFQEPT